MIDLSQHHDRLESSYVGVTHPPCTQFGQGGVLRKIFEIIGTTNKFFIEFGSDGHDYGESNTAHLRTLGFSGLLMSPIIYQQAKYKVHPHLVSADNVNDLFVQYDVPEAPDFLSIDIDGMDFYVWQAIKCRPRVISVECNGFFGRDVDCVMPHDPNYFLPPQYPRSNYAGASFRAMYNLNRNKGYTYVAQCGVDSICIADEVIEATNTEWLNANDYEKICNAYNGPIVEPLNELFQQNITHVPTDFFSSAQLI